jgi:GDPmannose 4,6-dehydratase
MTMSDRVLLLGVNGQDGILLSSLLGKKGSHIYGIGKDKKPSIELHEKVNYFSIDIRKTEHLLEFINHYEVNAIYNLAGISSVAYSFSNPVETFEINTFAVKRLLEGLRANFKSGLRFYQASSSEMFGISETSMQDELTPFNPVSPYAESKVETHLNCRAMREEGFFVSAGILFNHESIYRPESFVTRKITSGLARVSLGLQSSLTLGNLAAERDWGFAGDYVNAMYSIINHEKPDEFVVATGVKHSIQDIIDVSISTLGLDNSVYEMIKLDKSLSRPKDVKCLVGNARKCRSELGWSPKKSFEGLISEMALHDFNLLKNRVVKGQDH